MSIIFRAISNLTPGQALRFGKLVATRAVYGVYRSNPDSRIRNWARKWLSGEDMSTRSAWNARVIAGTDLNMTDGIMTGYKYSENVEHEYHEASILASTALDFWGDSKTERQLQVQDIAMSRSIPREFWKLIDDHQSPALIDMDPKEYIKGIVQAGKLSRNYIAPLVAYVTARGVK